MKANKQKVVYIITGLEIGGAELMLLRLLKSLLTSSQIEAIVISLGNQGKLAQEFRSTGAQVYCLGLNPAFPNPMMVIRLVRLLKAHKPTVVHTWMYHADFLGGLAAKLAGVSPIIWCIRNHSFDPKSPNLKTKLLVRINALISSWVPTVIVANSHSASNVHIQLGYDKSKMVVIPNGFDVSVFTPDSEARQSFRDEIGQKPTDIVIGLIARFDPLKDHQGFIEAAAILSKTKDHCYFILAGSDVNWENASLAKWIKGCNLEHRVHLLGVRKDINRIMASLDILTSSSTSESFPNVVGEAMACGIPCVVTDVGDTKLLIDNAGIVVPPNNPDKLAAAWKELLLLSPESRNKIGSIGRDRIVSKFSIEAITLEYITLYRSLRGGKPVEQKPHATFNRNR